MDEKRNLLSAIEDPTNDSTSLANLVQEWRGHVRSARSVDIQELCGIAAVHPLPWVRHATSQELYRRELDNEALLELALWLCHDYDDYVAFSALDFLGLRGSREHLRAIYSIIGIASDRLFTTAGKPVGIGHAVALRAIQRIVDSRDRRVYQEIERSLFQGLDDTEFVNQPCDLGTNSEHSHRSMSRIPGGTVRMGTPSSLADAGKVFDWSEEVRTVDVPGFHLEVNPVTTGEYRTFALSEAARSHEFCHPREPSGKVHVANTILDIRSGEDHPVTGVDWFDAFAYAAWCGKTLPTEEQWQRAAQGSEDQAFPWGDDFTNGTAHGYLGIQVEDWDSLLQWREGLLSLFDSPTSTTTISVEAATNVSKFGVRGMSGNVWEWTASSYLGGNFNPQTTQADALDVVYDQTSYAVIKGGAWTSLPEQLSPGFRGRDLAFDRHFEIGFRCACPCREDQDG